MGSWQTWAVVAAVILLVAALVWFLGRIEIDRVAEDGTATPVGPQVRGWLEASWTGLAFRVASTVLGAVVAVWCFQDGGWLNYVFGAVILLVLVLPTLFVGALAIAGWRHRER